MNNSNRTQEQYQQDLLDEYNVIDAKILEALEEIAHKQIVEIMNKLGFDDSAWEGDWGEIKEEALLEKQSMFTVAHKLHANWGIMRDSLSDETGIARSTLFDHLKRLESAGFVESRRVKIIGTYGKRRVFWARSEMVRDNDVPVWTIDEYLEHQFPHRGKPLYAEDLI